MGGIFSLRPKIAKPTGLDWLCLTLKATPGAPSPVARCTFELDSKFTELTGEKQGFGLSIGAGKYLQKKEMITDATVKKSFVKEYHMNRLLVNDMPVYVGYVLIGIKRADMNRAIANDV